MKKVLCLLVITMLVVSFAGCSKPVDKSGDQTEQPEVVKIALAGPMTGNYAHIGTQFKEGAELAIKEINDSGGINGTLLEIEYFDDKIDPKEAANIAQLLVSDNDIKAVIGHYTSSCCFAGIPIYDKADLAMITPSASSPDLTKDSTSSFKLWTGFDIYAPMLGDLAVSDLGKQNIAVIYAYNDWGIGVKDGFTARVKELGGNIVAEEIIYDGDKDFKTQLTNIKAEEPDAVAIFTYYLEGAMIAQQARNLGIDVQLIGSGTFYEEDFAKVAGDAAEGMYAINEFTLDDPKPSVQEFLRKYEEMYTGVPGNYQGNAYDAVMIIANAMEKNGFERSAIRDGIKEYQVEGVTGNISFTESREVIKDQSYLKFENGEWKFYKAAEIN